MKGEHLKVRRLIHGSGLEQTATVSFVLFLAVATVLISQGQPSSRIDTIHSLRPLLEVARLMEQRYASAVTYEDPITDSDPGLALGGTKGVPVPVLLDFVVPPELTPSFRPNLDAALLGEAVAAYHKQTLGTRYKILTSRIGRIWFPTRFELPMASLARPASHLTRS